MQKTQKSRMGLLLVASVVVLGGAGCTTVEDAQSHVAAATVIVQEKTSAIQAAIENAQKTYEKMKAIYEILNSEAAPEPATEPEVTPSVLPSEYPPQPAAEENTSSQ